MGEGFGWKEPITIGITTGVIVGGAVTIGVIGWAVTETTHPGTTKGLYDAISTSFNQAVANAENVINDITGGEATKVDENQGKDAKPGDTKENTNPYKGPVTQPVTVVDDKGNAIPLKAGESITGSPDGTFQQVRGKDGKQTGVRKDGKHGPTHNPEGKVPHAHRPDVPGTNHWLDIQK